ncbi:MAG: hypothetical protein GX558_04095, partial [Clostridiales bacterium]|nr:hypothetical protein [Clostridiales bacterium]
IAALLAALLITLPLGGCGSIPAPPAETAAPETATPEPAELPTEPPEPTPEPTPEPAPLADPADFAYTEVINETLGVRFDCPTAWTLNPARKTLRYDEPTPGGATPARLAITYTTVNKKPDANAMKRQMARFMDMLGQQYGSVTPLKTSTKESVMGVPSYMQRYAADNGGEQVLGMVFLAYVQEGRRLYLVHLSAQGDRYNALESTWKEIVASIRRVSS